MLRREVYMEELLAYYCHKDGVEDYKVPVAEACAI